MVGLSGARERSKQRAPLNVDARFLGYNPELLRGGYSEFDNVRAAVLRAGYQSRPGSGPKAVKQRRRARAAQQGVPILAWSPAASTGGATRQPSRPPRSKLGMPKLTQVPFGDAMRRASAHATKSCDLGSERLG